MKLKFSTLVFVLILSFVFLIFGCLQQPVTPQSTPTEITSPTAKASPSRIPTASLQVSPVATPTTLPKNLNETEFVSLCNSYTTDAEKQKCLQIAAYKFNNPTLCAEIKTFDQRVLCNAVAYSDAERCKQIANELTKSSCYNLVAINLRDENLCNKISEVNYKIDCFASIAFYKSSSKICKDNFLNALVSYKPLCLALATRDEKICDKAFDERVKTDCITSLAIALLDEKICKSLTSSLDFAVCDARVKQARSLRD